MPDFLMTLGFDKASIAKEYIDTLGEIQKTADKDKVVIQCDLGQDDVRKKIKELQKQKFTIGTDVVLNINSKKFSDSIKFLTENVDKVANRSAENISKALSESISKGLAGGIDLTKGNGAVRDIVRKYTGAINLSQKGIDKTLSELQAKIGKNLKVDDAAFTEMVEYLQSIKEFQFLLKNVDSKKYKINLETGSAEAEIKRVDSLLKNTLKSVGEQLNTDAEGKYASQLRKEFSSVARDFKEYLGEFSDFDNELQKISNSLRASFENIYNVKGIDNQKKAITDFLGLLSRVEREYGDITAKNSYGFDEKELGAIRGIRQGARDDTPIDLGEGRKINLGWEGAQYSDFISKLKNAKDDTELLTLAAKQFYDQASEGGKLTAEQFAAINAIVDELLPKWQKLKSIDLQKELGGNQKLLRGKAGSTSPIENLLNAMGLPDTFSLDGNTIINVSKQRPKTLIGTNDEGVEIDDTAGSTGDGSGNGEALMLETLKRKLEEVKTAVENKTQAFKTEEDVVADVVLTEISVLGSLEKQINDVETAIQTVISSFKALQKIDVSKIDLSGINSAQSSELVQTAKSLGDIDLPENFKDDIKGLVDSLKQLQNIKDLKDVSFENLHLGKLVDNLDSSKIDDLFALATALESLVPMLKSLNGITFTKKPMDAIENIGVSLENLSISLKNYNSEIITALNVVNELISKTEGLEKLGVVIKDPISLEQASNAINKAETEPETTSTEEESKKIEALIKQYDKLEKKVKKYAKLQEKSADGSITDNQAQDLHDIEKEFSELISASKQYVNVSSELKDKQDALNNALREQLLVRRDNTVSRYESSIDEAAKKTVPKSQVQEYNRLLDELRSKIEIIKALTIDGIIDGDNSDLKTLSATKAEIDKLLKTLSSSKTFTPISEESMQKLSTRIAVLKRNNSAMADDIKLQLDSIQRKINTVDNEADFDNLKAQVDSLEMKLKQTGQTGLSFMDKWGNKMKDLGAYLGSFASFYELIGWLKQGLQIIREYDDALTEMRKVSDQSVSSLKNYQLESFDIADEVGTTAKQIQQSTADYLRLGEAFTEAQESAKTTTILKNVSEFDSIDEATESMVAMSQAYSELDKIEILDILNNIGNNYPIATDALSRSLQRSAATLKVAGNDIYEAVALTVAGNRILQNEESVGTGLKTISLRMLGTEAAKSELEGLGEDTSDYIVQTKSKINEQLKSYTAVEGKEGVSLLDEDGNYRSTYEVLQDIADIYEKIVETDKKYGTNRSQALTELLGGKQRASVVASILMSPDTLRNAYNDAKNSEGSSQKELEKHLDSLSGKMDKLTNQAQEFWFNFLDSDTVKTAVDAATLLLSILDKIFKHVNAFAVAGAGAYAFFNKDKSIERFCPIWL